MLKLDSRKVTVGDIFIATKGEHTDGNNYVQSAIDAGAKLAVTDRNFDDARTITVPNTTKALIRLGCYFRARANLYAVIGITGSCGKTTVRNWLFRTLVSQSKNIIQSLHNYNTMISMPLNFEQLQYNTEIGIFELGTNSVGEILPLAKYVRPNIGIITNIYETHIGNFKDINELANEKVSIIEGIHKYGILLYDGACQFETEILKKCIERNITPVSIGFTNKCNFKINIDGKQVTVTSSKSIYKYKLKIMMKHYAYMSAIVIAILEKMELDVEKYISAIENLTPLQGRGIISKYKYNGKIFTLIDETYNAGPSAMLGTLEGLKQYNNRKVIVIGEMLELGDKSQQYHAKVAEKLNEFNNCKIYFIGSKSLWQLLQSYTHVECFEHVTAEGINKVLNVLQDDDILFLKGSRSIKLEQFIGYLQCLM